MIFLVDNGSVRADAYLNLCKIATEVSVAIGTCVKPAPLLHANKIPSEDLGGNSAVLLEEQLIEALSRGISEFTIFPLFFGESGAFTDYLPRRLKKLSESHGRIKVKILKPLFVDEDNGGDILAAILEDRIRSSINYNQLEAGTVVLVDHGSPKPAVTAVRNQLAQLLNKRFRLEAFNVVAASMERRPGPEYSFNEPLLETALTRINTGNVVVAQLFLAPGRHAGPNGDIASICDQAQAESDSLNIFRTDLVGDHPLITDLLVRRYKEAVSSSPEIYGD